MNCRELIAVIDDYLEGTLTREDLGDFERHLRDCAPCRAYLATYRKTKAIAADANRLEMPPEMKDRLRQFLLHRLARTS